MTKNYKNTKYKNNNKKTQNTKTSGCEEVTAEWKYDWVPLPLTSSRLNVVLQFLFFWNLLFYKIYFFMKLTFYEIYLFMKFAFFEQHAPNCVECFLGPAIWIDSFAKFWYISVQKPGKELAIHWRIP